MILTAYTAIPSLPLIASLRHDAPFSEAVSFQLAGLAVVLLSLSALWALCEIVSVWFKRTGAAAASRPAVSRDSAEASQSTVSEAADGAVTAVIAAAVFATLGRGAVIRQISAPATAQPNPQLAAWTLQGRLQHHTSHSPR